MEKTLIARVIKTNEIVNVKQVEKGSLYFMDDKNNNPYHCSELDFNTSLADLLGDFGKADVQQDSQPSSAFPSIYSSFNDFNKAMAESRKSQLEQDRIAYEMRMNELRADFVTSMMLDLVDKMDKVPTKKEVDWLVDKCEYVADKFFSVEKS